MKGDGHDGEAGSGGEEALQAARRQKAEAVRSRGGNPYANDVGANDRAQFGERRHVGAGAGMLVLGHRDRAGAASRHALLAPGKKCRRRPGLTAIIAPMVPGL